VIAVVEAVRLARTFGEGPQAIVALRSATCSLYPGQQVALQGPSGSGKSTLLHILAGLDTPSSGEVHWSALGERSATRLGAIGVVFQAPSLLPPLTVVENVALPLLLRNDPETAAIAAAHQALAALDMTGLANKLPEELSGGQSQRVAIARVLATDPVLIFADEPTGQLDHGTAAHVVDVLLEAARASGAALLINTHDEAIAERCLHRWTMADGVLDVPSSSRTEAAR
jgi:ABC-type lipoprotein export system ATPase subunit